MTRLRASTARSPGRRDQVRGRGRSLDAGGDPAAGCGGRNPGGRPAVPLHDRLEPERYADPSTRVSRDPPGTDSPRTRERAGRRSRTSKSSNGSIVRSRPRTSQSLSGWRLPIVLASVFINRSSLRLSSPRPVTLDRIDEVLFARLEAGPASIRREAAPLPLPFLDADLWIFRIPAERSCRARSTS